MSVQQIFGAGFAGLTEKEQIRRAATELEAVVLTQLLSAMRKTVPEGTLLEESPSNEIFRSLLDAELARETAKRSPFGLADAIVRELESAKSITNSIKAPAEEAELPRDDTIPRASSFRRIG